MKDSLSEWHVARIQEEKRTDSERERDGEVMVKMMLLNKLTVSHRFTHSLCDCANDFPVKDSLCKCTRRQRARERQLQRISFSFPIPPPHLRSLIPQSVATLSLSLCVSASDSVSHLFAVTHTAQHSVSPLLQCVSLWSLVICWFSHNRTILLKTRVTRKRETA